MKRRFIEFLLYSNLIVSLSAAILTLGISKMYHIKSGELYAIFSFLGTYAVYNAQRIVKKEFFAKTPWLAWVDTNKNYIASSILVVVILSGLVLIQLEFNLFQWLALSVSTVISLLYVSPYKRLILRAIPGLKIHLISLSWAAVLILLPLLSDHLNGNELVQLFGAHYLYVVAITIPFDIRDLKYDAPSQKTIPQVLGVKKARALATILLFAFAFWMFVLVDGLMFNMVFALAILLQVGLINFVNEKSGDLYCAGLIDGCIVFLGLAYYIN